MLGRTAERAGFPGAQFGALLVPAGPALLGLGRGQFPIEPVALGLALGLFPAGPGDGGGGLLGPEPVAGVLGGPGQGLPFGGGKRGIVIVLGARRCRRQATQLLVEKIPFPGRRRPLLLPGLGRPKRFLAVP